MRTSNLIALASLLVACGDDGGPINDQELITTVTLTFAPEGGGASVRAAFDDPDGDGGDPPTVDPIELVDGTSYALTVTFENRLEDPPEDITLEVADESDQHQLFFTGTAVDGPASDQPGAPLTHGYDDEDVHGLPVGLVNTIDAASGSGDLTVTLRHLPPINDVAVKTAEVAATVAVDGLSAIGGSSDAQVSFDVTVL